MLFHFATYDIETVAVGDDVKISDKTTAHGFHSIISVAIHSTWDGKDFFYCRDDMTKGAGIKLIKQFLMKIQDLARLFESVLPKEAILYHEKLKEDIKTVRYFSLSTV